MAELEPGSLGAPGLAVDFRRRLVAGIIVLAALAHPWLKSVSTSTLGRNAELATSPVFAVFLIAAAYVVGALVETAGEVLLARVAGNYLWAFVVPFNWFNDLRLPFRYMLRLVVALPSGAFLAYFYIGRALLGKSDFRWLDPPAIFSSKAQAYFLSLPECIKAGLQAPFGDRQELSWKSLQNSAGPVGAAWLLVLENRNRDALTIVSALIISVSALTFSDSTFRGIITIMVSILVLFYLYLIALRKSIVDAVEWVAVHGEHDAPEM
jgi:hypothetical protein